MTEIEEQCPKMKGQDGAVVKGIFVMVADWKAGIRKIQIKVSGFYESKMRHFEVVNDC